MEEEIRPGKYNTFQVCSYEILSVAQHTEKNRKLLFARPKYMFFEIIVYGGGGVSALSVCKFLVRFFFFERCYI